MILRILSACFMCKEQLDIENLWFDLETKQQTCDVCMEKERVNAALGDLFTCENETCERRNIASSGASTTCTNVCDDRGKLASLAPSPFESIQLPARRFTDADENGCYD